MRNRAADLRAIRRTEARRNRFVNTYARAFNTAIAKQVDLLKPFYQDIASGIATPELLVNSLFEPEAIQPAYDRLYFEVGGKAATWTRKDLEPAKSYNIRSIKQDPEITQEQFAAVAGSALGDVPDSVVTAVQRYLQSYGGQRIVTINGTTKELALRVIQDLLAQGIEEGLSAQEIGRLLERNVPQRMRKYNFRGGMIARTEVLGAYNLGEMEQVKDLDVTIKKYWMARLDGRERPAHGDAYLNYRDAPIDKFEDFIVGGQFMNRPGDPNGGAANVVNCRCVLGYRR